MKIQPKHGMLIIYDASIPVQEELEQDYDHIHDTSKKTKLIKWKFHLTI